MVIAVLIGLAAEGEIQQQKISSLNLEAAQILDQIQRDAERLGEIRRRY
jgi:hypothetical protein